MFLYFLIHTFSYKTNNLVNFYRSAKNIFATTTQSAKIDQNCYSHVYENVLDIFHNFISLVNFYRFAKKLFATPTLLPANIFENCFDFSSFYCLFCQFLSVNQKHFGRASSNAFKPPKSVMHTLFVCVF